MFLGPALWVLVLPARAGVPTTLFHDGNGISGFDLHGVISWDPKDTWGREFPGAVNVN